MSAPAIPFPAPELVGSGDAAAASADPLAALLQQAAESDPRVRIVAQMMQARAAAESTRHDPIDRVADVEQRLRRVRDAYLDLRDRYLRVAAALGACPRCWGEDPRCRECGGAGASGFFEPDRELFQHYVVPAVRRATHRSALRAPRAPGAPEPRSQVEG